MLDVDLECIELECAAAGAKSCKFMVGLPGDREVAVPLDQNLENVLVEIADTTEAFTTRQMDLAVRLLEPLLLLVMALVTLVVVSGLLLPVFRMSSVM